MILLHKKVPAQTHVHRACVITGHPDMQEWTDYLYELKKQSRSAADEELTNELKAMTDTPGTLGA
jgi:hypothetical protein